MFLRTLLIVVFCVVSFDSFAQGKVLDIQSVTSPSGLNAWLVEDHSVPVISLRFAFEDMGSKMDLPSKQGLARLVSNTMDEGAGEIKSQEFQKILNDESITLRFSVDRDHFYGDVKTLTRNKEKALELLALALTMPRFDQEPMDRMRASNISRIKSSITDPDWIAARLQNDKIFQDHPYALNSGGTLSTLENISTDDLKSFHKQLGRKQLLVAAAGDITKEELASMLDVVFMQLPEGEVQSDAEPFDLKNQGKTYLYEKDIPQSIIRISQPGIRRSDSDYYPAKVMNFILGESGFGSRLMEEIREKRGLTYGVYSFFQEYDETDGLFVSTSTVNASVPEMISLIEAEWEKMKATTVSAEELKDAKSYLIGSLPLNFTSTDAISNTLLDMQLNDLPPDYLDQSKQKIQATTAEEIQKAAQRVLNKNSFTTIFVGQPEGIKDYEKIDALPNVN
ncbi:MAG: insulinase family protein [Alphaproteobacteria bacterium]|nr:insulinase family protein [Alphaproteobacteria bacterium]